MPKGRPEALTPDFSVYLDAVRFCAACLVLVAHMRKYNLLGSAVPLDDLGHESVMAFFVLSGIVIAHSALRAGTTLKEFALARAARLYSVVIPALLLSFGLALLTQSAGESSVAVGFVTSIAFLNECWFQWQDVPWNGPYWSLCYEAWYYVLLGIGVFRHGRARIVLLVLAAALAGPRILILLPVWWAGVWFLRIAPRLSPRPVLGGILLGASMVAFVWLGQSPLDIAIRDSLKVFVPQIWLLKSSELFVTDYLAGVLVLANFAAFKMLEPTIRGRLATIGQPIRWLAGFTFSIYLFHYPLLLLVRRAVPADYFVSTLASAGIFVALLAACILLGSATEKQKSRFRDGIEWLLTVVSGPRRVL